MKSTGVTRKIDELGRVVLPVEIRRVLDLNSGDPMEIFIDDDKIVLKKYHPSCVFCSGTEGLLFYKGRLICKDCLDSIKKI